MPEVYFHVLEGVRYGQKESRLMKMSERKYTFSSIRLAQERAPFVYHYPFDLHRGKISFC